MKYLMCALLLLLAFPAQAQQFSKSDLEHTWVIVGSGSGALDEFGDVIHCNFSCTVRVEKNGVITGKACRVNIAGKEGYSGDITSGKALVTSNRYAAWSLTFTIDAPSGPLKFTGTPRHQFAYRDWNANDKAIGPFYHGVGPFEASNGMIGIWHFGFNRP